MDVCGPISPLSIEFKNFVEKQFNKNIQKIITDNGLEFVNSKTTTFLIKHGIQGIRTVPYTPEQNGIAERGNLAIVEKARCLLLHSKLPLNYWAEACNTATYLLNRSPSSSINFLSPYERLFGSTPRLDHLHPFGCQTIADLPKAHQGSKFDARGIECIFLGYVEEYFAVGERNSVEIQKSSSEALTLETEPDLETNSSPSVTTIPVDSSPSAASIPSETCLSPRMGIPLEPISTTSEMVPFSAEGSKSTVSNNDIDESQDPALEDSISLQNARGKRPTLYYVPTIVPAPKEI